MLFFASLPLCAQDATGVGIAPITIPDPVNGGTMPGFVFYPSTQLVEHPTPIGPYDVAANFGAAEIPGAKPLIVISHGNGGANLGHHDLATYLAGHGFIVVTLEHPKDNFHDQSGVGKSRVLIGRPVQVSATISALLKDPRWKELIDSDRIGVAGFSAGGYTSLMVVGAVPRFQRFIGYCDRYPKDEALCGEMHRLLAADPANAKRIADFMATMQQDAKRWGDTRDPRVKSAFVMAPLSLLFEEAGVAGIDRPVFLYYAEDDRVLLPQENALHIRALIRTLTATRQVPKADHWVFLPPCSPKLAADAAEICSDPAGVDRAKVHRRVNTDALEFFRKTLGTASH